MTKKTENKGCFLGLEGELWYCVKGIQKSHFQEIGYFFKNPVRFQGKFLHKSSFRGQILREKHAKIIVLGCHFGMKEILI